LSKSLIYSLDIFYKDATVSAPGGARGADSPFLQPHYAGNKRFFYKKTGCLNESKIIL